MPAINSALSRCLPAPTLLSSATLAGEPDTGEKWFDALEYVELESDISGTTAPHAGSASLIPFTEDCLRCLQQLILSWGEYKETEFIGTLLSQLLPAVPAQLATTASALYHAVTEGRQIDVALLQMLGLASTCLPDQLNPVPSLATRLRETITGYVGEEWADTWLAANNSGSASLYTALAAVAIAARYTLSGDAAPQRTLLKVPLFFAGLLQRASYYWNTTNRLSHPVINSAPHAAEALPGIEFHPVETRPATAITSAAHEGHTPLLNVAATTAVAVVATSNSGAFSHALQSRTLVAAVSASTMAGTLIAGKLAFDHILTSGISAPANSSTDDPEALEATHQRLVMPVLPDNQTSLSAQSVEQRLLLREPIDALFAQFPLVGELDGETEEISASALFNMEILSLGSSLRKNQGFYVITLPRQDSQIKMLQAGLTNPLAAGNNTFSFDIRFNTPGSLSTFFSVNDRKNTLMMSLARSGPDMIIRCNGKATRLKNRFNQNRPQIPTSFAVNIAKSSSPEVKVLQNGNEIFSQSCSGSPDHFFLGLAHAKAGRFSRSVEIKNVSKVSVPERGMAE